MDLTNIINVLFGGTVGYVLGEAARRNNLVFNIGQHVHHDVLSLGLLTLVGVSYGSGKLPVEWATFLGGLGGGGLVHHLVSEYSCSEGVCLIPEKPEA